MRSDNPLNVRIDATGPPAVRSAHPVPVGCPHVQHSDTAPRDEWQWWWQYTVRCARQFLAGIEPPAIEIYGPVLEPDEYGLLETDLTVSRLYAGDGSYRCTDVLLVGRPAVMVGALAASAVVNHRRKVAARRDAVPRWHDEQRIHVWVTTHRLICEDDDGLHSHWYDAITEFYPDLQRWSLTVGFDDGQPPLRLTGPAAPMLCLWIATATIGPRWAGDPRLTPLLAA